MLNIAIMLIIMNGILFVDSHNGIRQTKYFFTYIKIKKKK